MEIKDIIGTLKNVSLFQNIPLDSLTELTRQMKEVRYSSGEYIIREGDKGDALYVLLDGSVEVLKKNNIDGEDTLSFMSPHECFGELALLDDQPRAASVKSVQSSHLLKLPRDVFIQYIQEHPAIAFNIFPVLTQRVRQMNNLFRTLEQRENREALEQEIAKKEGYSSSQFVQNMMHMYLPKSGVSIKSLTKDSGIFTNDIVDDETLATRLKQAGLLNEEEIITALNRARATGYPLARIIINRKLVDPKLIQDIIESDLGTQAEPSKSQLEMLILKATDEHAKVTSMKKGDTLSGNREKYIVQLIDEIIMKAIDEDASDIHIEPQKPRSRVRFRIDGQLHETVDVPYQLYGAIVSSIKAQAEMDIANRQIPQDGKLHFHNKDRGYVLRVATSPVGKYEKIVMRIHDDYDIRFGLRELGLSDKQFIKFNSVISKPYGMFLVTGPVGSGKTTTLYAVLNGFDVLKKNIMTIEDPVEYELTGVNHIEVNHKVGLDFASGLKAILRQDPDIIMVGEIRDQETARVATRASCTGVLLLSTMHTNDATSAITALRHQEIDTFFISNALVGIIAQRLIRKLCPRCAESYEPDTELMKSLDIPAGKPPVFKRPVGCPECHQTGYKGRTGIFEILDATEEIKQSILSGEDESKLRKIAKSQGMMTLRQDALNKILEGITSVEELYRVTM